MRYLILISAIVAPTFANAVYHNEKPKINWPKTKYEDGMCITPTNTSWEWYGQTGYVQDIVYSKYLDGFAYKIKIYGMTGVELYDLFAIPAIDTNTAQVRPCPN